MKARFEKRVLKFKRPGETSRGILKTKKSYYLILEDGHKKGVGECSLIQGLSYDDVPEYESVLQQLCKAIEQKEKLPNLTAYPSIQMGYETALLSVQSANPFTLFSSEFSSGKASIPINGLVWMGDHSFMQKQITSLLHKGFSCIKLKTGAIDFETELALIASIRRRYSKEDVTIRVDANGGFAVNEAIKKLEMLAPYDIHSIEQPIATQQWEAMQELCRETPIPIALDEELIGVFEAEKQEELLQCIQPQYIILKPSLVGGFTACERWIKIAKKHHIGWWATSALESNVGLNAIAQWTFLQNNPLPHGLGTGSLFENNVESPLEVNNGYLCINESENWNFNF